MTSLREKVLKSGAYLLARHGLGLIFGLAGVVLLTRTIGPGNYGLYASALGIVSYLSTMAGLGLHVYIVRREAEPDLEVYNQAFTVTFVTGVTGLLLGILAIPLLQRWYQDPAFIPPLLAMLLTLPFTAMAGPAAARLERELNFKAVAAVELAGQVIYYLVALTLAYLGKGVWAPVVAYIILQFFLFFGVCGLAHLIPRLHWSKPMLREMLKYGAGYSASIWVWQLRSLVNPLVVGHYAGPEEVGFVALAVRLVDALSFVKGAAWRLSIAALARLQENYLQLKRAMEEAMVLQVLALGPIFAIFACLAPSLLPMLFGERWHVVLMMYPFIAVGCLVNAVFSMHSSALYVLRRNLDVTIFHVLHIILFAGGAFLFLPRFGLLGYGLAEILALFSYIIIHFQVKRIFLLSYMKVLPWLISFLPSLFTSIFVLPSGFFLLIPLLIVLFVPAFNRELARYIRIINRDIK
ncbi:MAG: oligosaccharide flippase family protein [Desulfotomaculaceae bacterium]